jgi:hypothetical protein
MQAAEIFMAPSAGPTETCTEPAASVMLPGGATVDPTKAVAMLSMRAQELEITTGVENLLVSVALTTSTTTHFNHTHTKQYTHTHLTYLSYTYTNTSLKITSKIKKASYNPRYFY